jgi:hypothetical protein
MKAPVAPSSVHRPGFVEQFGKALVGEMFACFHPANYAGEAFKLLVLATHKRIALEEGNHSLQEIIPLSDDQHQSVVIRATMVLADAPTADLPLDEVGNLSPYDILTDPELGSKLPTNPASWVALNCYVKTTFTIDETRNVRVQPFLLIDRT